MNQNEIIINNTTPQNIGITQNKNQEIIIDGGSITIGISDVLVNDKSVVENNIAYVVVPTKTSELINDSGFITLELDPTVPTFVKNITQADIVNWNSKQPLLVSGSNIKTINSNSLLGSGNIQIEGNTYTAGDGISIENNVITNEITSYDDLTDLPTIPTKTSDLINDNDFVSENELSDVAFSGSYVDLSNTPDIPTDVSELDNDVGYITKDVNDLTNYTLSSNLSTVATTGDYDDLTNKPTIPTVNNGALTIQINGSTVNTFTANSSVDVTTNITVPTKMSDLTNDTGFVTNSDLSNLTFSTWTDISSNVTVGANYTSLEKRIYVNEKINLCYVHLNVKATGTSGDFASGLPKALQSLSINAINSTTVTPVWVWVRSAGTMACGTTHANNDQININGCYPYSTL